MQNVPRDPASKDVLLRILEMCGGDLANSEPLIHSYHDEESAKFNVEIIILRRE
jgi:hypothetical protein